MARSTATAFSSRPAIRYRAIIAFIAAAAFWLADRHFLGGILAGVCIGILIPTSRIKSGFIAPKDVSWVFSILSFTAGVIAIYFEHRLFGGLFIGLAYGLRI